MANDSLHSREKILDAAEALFARRGYTGVGLREVAEASGLVKSSLFHHFRSKAQLYCEVIARVLDRIQLQLAPVFASRVGVAERLDRIIEALIDALAEHPPTARLLLRSLVEEGDFDSAEEAQRVDETLAEILDGIGGLLREGVEAGVFRRVSVPHMVQTLIGATVYHFASGDLGEGLLGRPILCAEEVRRRKREIQNLLHNGLALNSSPQVLSEA